tara:strand:+ start:1322 stop:2104 length:783 start_codon:yes stop_codon:yes gene_type:complete
MFTLATYNILHGHYEGLILGNVSALIQKGMDIICLQEADSPFETSLGKHLDANGLSSWKISSTHHGVGTHLAFVRNSSRVRLENTETLLLPTTSPGPIQRLKFPNTVIQRAAVFGTFRYGNKVVIVVNTHLAWEGGTRHRLAQLRCIKEVMDLHKTGGVILAGDFNTVTPPGSKKRHIQQIEVLLGKKYRNVLPDLPWSCDMSYTAPQDKWETVAKICRVLKVKLRFRLDYIFTKNMGIDSAYMLDMPGSDHKPLVVKAT